MRRKKSIFTSDEPSLIVLISERDNLIDLINYKTLNLLKAKKANAQARIEAAERPEGVLTKYREFLREAQRDDQTLKSLEQELQKSLLIRAKQEMPWDLITNPTVFDKPVSPRKKYVFGASLLIGLILSSSCCIYLGYKSDKVWSEELINSLLKYPLIDTLGLNNIYKSKILEVYLKNKIIENNAVVNIGFFVNGDLYDSNIKKFKEKFD